MTDAIKGFPARFPVRDDDQRPMRYRVSSVLGRMFLRLVLKVRIEGRENVPAEGPLVVVCNHISNLDPMLFGAFFPRTLFAMAKRELSGNPLTAWWFAGCNCIPVDRSAPDRRAVTRALSVLRRKGRLLVFLEGTRSPTATMQQAEPGAGFLVRRSGATVQPVAVWGTEHARRRSIPMRRRIPVTMRFGAPFAMQLDGRRDDAAIADEMGQRVAALLPPRYRGVYGEPGADG